MKIIEIFFDFITFGLLFLATIADLILPFPPWGGFYEAKIDPFGYAFTATALLYIIILHVQREEQSEIHRTAR